MLMNVIRNTNIQMRNTDYPTRNTDFRPKTCVPTVESLVCSSSFHFSTVLYCKYYRRTEADPMFLKIIENWKLKTGVQTKNHCAVQRSIDCEMSLRNTSISIFICTTSQRSLGTASIRGTLSTTGIHSFFPAFTPNEAKYVRHLGSHYLHQLPTMLHRRRSAREQAPRRQLSR